MEPAPIIFCKNGVVLTTFEQDPSHPDSVIAPLLLPPSTKRFVQLYNALILIAAGLGQGEFGVEQ